MYRFKGIIIPYCTRDGTPHIMLGKAHIGNYGYLGGTQEDGEDEDETAAREFWEESKGIVPIFQVLKAIRTHSILIYKRYKKIDYFFFVIPWKVLSKLSPEEFIQHWRDKQMKGAKFNEKIDVKLVSIYSRTEMTRTVRMILPKIRFAIQRERFSIALNKTLLHPIK